MEEEECKKENGNDTFISPLVLSSSYLTLLPLPISTTCHGNQFISLETRVKWNNLCRQNVRFGVSDC